MILARIQVDALLVLASFCVSSCRAAAPAPASLDASSADFLQRSAAAAGNVITALPNSGSGKEASIEDAASPSPSAGPQTSCGTGVLARPSYLDDIPSQKAALVRIWQAVRLVPALTMHLSC